MSATFLFMTPASFCRTSAARPRKSTPDLSLHVKPREDSRGVSSILEQRRKGIQIIGAKLGFRMLPVAK